MEENSGSCSHATPQSVRTRIGRSWNGRRTIAAMRPCRVTPESMHGLHRAAVVPQPHTTTCLPRSRVQVARVLVAGSGRLATRATTPTTSAERRRHSRFPSYPGVTRDKLVRQAKRQRLSSLASISRRQQVQRQPQGVGTPHLRRAPRRAPRQGPVVAADSKQIVEIVERMVPDGAISLLPTATLVLAPSTPAGRHRPAVGGRHRRRLRLHRRHLQHQRRRQAAPMETSIAQIGPPMENVRATPAGCWKTVS